MTLLCEHFVYSKTTGLIASSNIEKWLSAIEIDFLCHAGDNATEECCLRIRINPQIVAIIYIKPIKDEYKRKIIWNHTILIKYQDYFENRELEPARLIAAHFLHPTSKLPKTLEPIQINV